MGKYLLQLLVLAIISGRAYSSRMLFLLPSPSKSHVIVAQGLAQYLADNAHDVTMISPFPLSKPRKNYRDVVMKLDDEIQEFSKMFVENSNKSMLFNMNKIYDIGFIMTKALLDLPETKKLMKEEKFDLIFIGFFLNEVLLGLGDYFKCPTIMISAQPAFGTINDIVGNPSNIASVPHMLKPSTGGITKKMTFVDRLINYAIYIGEQAMLCYVDYRQKKIYDEYFPSERGYRSYEDSKKNLSIVLVNSHFTQNVARAQVPAIIEVGGLTVKQKAGKLPGSIQSFLDGANEHGAILFSFGTNAKTTYLPKEKLEALLKVFSKLKQRVIMKWESDELEGRPENVMIVKWLPQDDILAHKNLKIFISHCGLGGVVEARYHGVPIIGIPLMGDQPGNADTIVKEGWAVKVDFATLTEESLSNAINEILVNSKYSRTVEHLSKLYRDRPLNAHENALFWIEYVIRHNGAKHLQHPAVHQNFIERNSYDVLATIMLIFYLSFKLTCFILKKLLRKILRMCGFLDTSQKKITTKKIQ